jgi:arylsulfatase A-like enzyme
MLPRPDSPFRGKIERTVKGSIPDFPKGVEAPAGAPNVLLILTDDVGFGASSTFGGPIPTPTFQRLADSGLRYTKYHTTALCSPTRAALITGRNHYSVASGVITEFATGYPGYNSLVPRSAGSVGAVLKDNRASAEGTLQGITNEVGTAANGVQESIPFLLSMIDELGGPKTYKHYPVGWAHAMDAPMQWTKQIASHFGGTRNGMVISWPARIKDKGGLRSQFCHVIDIVPTIYEAAQITPPEVLDGVEQKPLDGLSLVYTFDKVDAPTVHNVQYFEMFGNRAIYKDGWMASTTPLRLPWVTIGFAPSPDDFKWELYNRRGREPGKQPRRQVPRQTQRAPECVRCRGQEIQCLSSRF